MARLIDADKLFPYGSVPFYADDGFKTADRIYGIIKNAPTVNAVELPCKIGDYAYAIRNYKRHIYPRRGLVTDMYFIKGMKLQIVVKNVTRGEWGKTVFGTAEEAYAEIERRKQ